MNMTGLVIRFIFIFIRITLVYDDEYHELIARHMLPVFLLYWSIQRIMRGNFVASYWFYSRRESWQSRNAEVP